MLEYFNSLTPKEVISFKSFVRSPYFGTNTAVIKLLKFLTSKHPNITKEDLTKKRIAAAVFGRRKVNDARLRKAISDFYKTFDNFITQKELENDRLNKKLILSKGLRKRGFVERHRFHVKELRPLNKKNSSDYFSYFHDEFEIDNEIYLYSLEFTEEPDPEILRSMTDSLDHHYIFLKLNVLIEMEIRKINDNVEYEYNLEKEILEYIKKNEEYIRSKYPVIYSLYLILLMLRTMEEKYAEELESVFFGMKFFNYYFTKKFISVMEIFCLYRIHEKFEWKYQKKLVELYDYFYFKVPKKYSKHIKENILTSEDFLNPVWAAIGQKRLKWAAKFMGKYKDSIVKESATATFNYASAIINFFGKKNYETALKFLSKVKPNKELFYVYSRYIYAQLYYETNDLEGVKNMLTNLRQMAKRRDMTDLQRNFILSFADTFAKIIKISQLPKPERKVQKKLFINTLMTSKKRVTERGWFVEKLKEM